MLTHLKLENFKIWRSTGPTRLAPITLLLGTNSSGKSSLIQSLLPDDWYTARVGAG